MRCRSAIYQLPSELSEVMPVPTCEVLLAFYEEAAELQIIDLYTTSSVRSI